MKSLICYFITGRWKKIIEWLFKEYCNLIHSLLYLIFLTLPPTPRKVGAGSSLKLKGRRVTDCIPTTFTLPLLFKGRDGDGLRISKEELDAK
jgi:hypothetical protein